MQYCQERKKIVQNIQPYNSDNRNIHVLQEKLAALKMFSKFSCFTFNYARSLRQSNTVHLHPHMNSHLHVYKSTDSKKTFTFIQFEFEIANG